MMAKGMGTLADGWSRLRRRLASRQDTEHEQAVVRIVIGILVVVYMGVQYQLGDRASARLAFRWGTPFVVASLAIFGAIVYSPAASPVRRICGMVLDFGTL